MSSGPLELERKIRATYFALILIGADRGASVFCEDEHEIAIPARVVCVSAASHLWWCQGVL